jgi:hypothetical protein
VPYGDPAADQGENDGAIHYTYLLWSWIDVAGGGTVRTLLAQGQVVRACDVASITSPSYGSDGAVNGEVTARYVRALAGSCPVYGWMVWSHTYYGNRAGAIAHATAMSIPPAPEPPPDPACPVAEPASPPIARTSGARPASRGTALTGSVNPKGVPTSYLFQLGTTRAYGASTPTETLASPDKDLAVRAPVSGLRPGAAYHYRLVATNTHGVRYGADRMLTPPKLKRLRVAPKAAAIQFKLSARSTVTVTFTRITVGGRRLPVRGSLTRTVKAGRVSLPVSGRIGGRRLPRGRYVATATPRDATGLVGASRTARFTVERR